MKFAPLLVPLFCALVSTTTAAQPTTLDLAAEGYEFEGWGVSLCWWAHQVGDWPEERLEPLLEAITDPVEGLGLTHFRYNIGGGDDPTHDHLRPGGDVPGFQAGPDQPLDPEADPNQRRVMLRLIDLVRQHGGEPVLEAFSNSPPYWMTKSGCASGGKDGAPNLPDDRVEDFASYLADVTRLYRDRYGVTFGTLDPFNEPNSTWWRTSHNQEGCQIPQTQQGAVLNALHRALSDRGLAEATVLSATDGHGIDWTLANVRAMDAATLSRVGQINTHSYSGDRRRELREFATAAGKPLWQSESGPMNLDGPRRGWLVEMMGRVALDLNELQPSVWCLWQAVSDTDAWGCFRMDEAAHTFWPSRSYGLYAQYTRALRPGDRVVPITDRELADKLVVTVSADGGRATLIVVNDQAEPQQHEVRLTGAKLDSEARSTRSSRTETCEPVEVATLRGDTLRIDSAPYSVTTVVVPLM